MNDLPRLLFYPPYPIPAGRVHRIGKPDDEVEVEDTVYCNGHRGYVRAADIYEAKDGRIDKRRKLCRACSEKRAAKRAEQRQKRKAKSHPAT